MVELMRLTFLTYLPCSVSNKALHFQPIRWRRRLLQTDRWSSYNAPCSKKKLSTSLWSGARSTSTDQREVDSFFAAWCSQVLRCQSPPTDNRQHRCRQGEPPSSDGCPLIDNMAVKHHEGETETLDSSTVRTIGNYSSHQGICPPPILALLEGLVKTTTTSDRRRFLAHLTSCDLDLVLWPWPSTVLLKIGTPVTPALGNVQTNFDFSTPFIFEIGIDGGQTEWRTDGQEA